MNYPNTKPSLSIPVLDKNNNIVNRPVEFYFSCDDNLLSCCDIDAIDYHGEFRGGYPYISSVLEEWADKNGGYWEWDNCETISFTL